MMAKRCPRSHAEARGVQFEPQRLDVLAVAVGQHQDLVADPAGLPQAFMTNTSLTAVHAIVSTPLALIAVGEFHEARQMLRIAGRRERAGHREQHHGLALEQLVGGDLLRAILASSG